jgi:tetratricopeptide (TPR) repeat protein
VCLDASEKLAGIWDANGKASLRRTFLASNDPRAAATWGAVEQALDKYTRDWSVARGQSCTAVRAKGGLEPETIRRMACLDDRLTAIRGLMSVFEHPDGEIMSNAIAASHSLRPVSSCQDPSALDSTVNAPEPRSAARVSELRQELSVVTALTDTQKLKDAQTRAASLVESAHAVGYTPLEAEALLAHARVLKAVAEVDKVTPLLYRAAWLADSSGDDKTRAVAWLRLLGYLGMSVGPKEGPDLEIVRKQAIAAYERCRSHDGGRQGDELEIEYLTALNEDALGPGKYEEARKRTTELVALSEKLYGDANWKYATALDSLAKTNLLLGDNEASLAHLERARGVLERASAVDTTLYAKVESATGKNLLALFRVTEAEAHFRRAIEIEEHSGRPDNQRLVIPLYNLGMTLAEQGKYDDAAAAYERSIALLERTTPRSDSRYWEMDIALAETELRQGKARAALSRIEAITKNQEAHDYFPVADFVLAETLFALKRDPRRAHALAKSALNRLVSTNGRKGPRYEHRLAEVRVWLDQHQQPTGGGRAPAA